MKDTVWAITDINNCYCSCERVFNPSLNNRPVIVLSNNDGCAVARSAEAKALGIKMGQPKHEWEHLIARHNIAVLSSNYALYGEFSHRFYSVIGQFVAPEDFEPYSIDEVFVRLDPYQNIYEYTAVGRQIKERIYKWLGLPVCVGIGRTKTQAKLANFIAKKNPCFGGVCNLMEADRSLIRKILVETPVDEVWGVGRRIAKRLEAMSIYTIMDLIRADAKVIGRHFSSVLERTVLELQGISCLQVEDLPADKQQIMSSRSFGQSISDKSLIKEALTHYTINAVDKLRAQNSYCRLVSVGVQTSWFDRENYFSPHLVVQLNDYTNDVFEINQAVTFAVDRIFKDGHKFKRGGIVLHDIIPKKAFMPNLFTDHSHRDERENLNQAFAKVNARFGRNTIMLGLSGKTDRAWSMKQAMRSQDYFSDAKQLMEVR